MQMLVVDLVLEGLVFEGGKWKIGGENVTNLGDDLIILKHVLKYTNSSPG